MGEPQRLVTELEPDGSCIIPIMPHNIDCTQDCQEQLRRFGIIPSMSRKGQLLCNAPMERLRGWLKHELVHHRRYATRAQAQQGSLEYIRLSLTVGSGILG